MKPKKNTIDAIFVACYKNDHYLTRTCVASIRYFYPDIKIYLIKDYLAGDFDTTEVEKHWNVSVYPFERKKFGWALSHLEPFFLNNGQKVLVMDNDIVFIGKVLDQFEEEEADFIVWAEDNSKSDLYSKWAKDTYYDYELLKKNDPSFEYPGFFFNCGAMVLKTNILKRSDFESLIEWSHPPILKRTDIFSCADQGILNYAIAKKIKDDNLKVKTSPFMIWSKSSFMKEINLNEVKNKNNQYPYLIHWAGTKPINMKYMERYDILLFFEKYYYTNIEFQYIKRISRNLNRSFLSLKHELKKIKLSIDKKIRS